MDRYLFKMDKSLIDLGAVQIDKNDDYIFDEAQEEGTLKFISEKGEKLFKFDKEQKIIEGRGIKGFFKEYDSDYILIEHIDKATYKILNNQKLDIKRLNKIGNGFKNIQHMENVLGSLVDMKQGSEKWFKLYDMSREFSGTSDSDKLISLPYLRDLEMYDYQLKTVKAVIKRFRGRVLLCDEVGLGKTIEAGIAMMEYITRGLVKKILILVPPSLVGQWSTEIKRKFNQDFITSDDPLFKKMGNDGWSHYNKVIASLSSAKRKNNSEIIEKINYDLVIVDEAHHLKNRNTTAWKFVNNLQKKYIFLLTATPVQNNLEELYNLITLLKPGQLKTYTFFKNNFIKDKEGLEVKNADRLRNLLSDVMIRNKRSDIDITFTKRTAKTFGINLSERELKLYNETSNFIRKKYKNEDCVLTRFMLKNLQEEMGSSLQAAVDTLNRYSENEKININDRKVLKSLSNEAEDIAFMDPNANPKIQQLHKILINFNDKMIIFTKFRNTQKFIVDFLRNAGYTVAEFHGGLSRKEKEFQIEYFKDKASVLVSTEAGGEGRNLQFCNGMVNYDLPWNPMAIEQRIGRIHRVGQTREVFLYNLAAKDTVEYYILDLLDKKINMFELVVGEVDMILGDMEDEADFSDIIMDAWVKASAPLEMEDKIEDISKKLIENKRQYFKIREIDNKLFDNSLKSMSIGEIK